MKKPAFWAAASMTAVIAAGALGQYQGNDSSNGSSARVETAQIEILRPERYQVPVVFEPIRRVAIMATDDGIVLSTPVAVGSTIRENQEIVQLDRGVAAANLKVAEAEVAEREATLKAASNATYEAIYTAQLAGAKAKAELAKLALDRCTLRAPFPGRLLTYTVSPGQYVVKGTNLADLADVATLKVLVPVDRTQVKEGQTLELVCEGKTVSGKVQTVLPLHEGFSVLRELATPWAAAWVYVENGKGQDLEPGQRVRSPYLPNSPITAVPNRAIQRGQGGLIVQVVRNEHVVDVPVQVLGSAGLDRTQVAGVFWPYDVAIVESNPPLVAGTYLRFGGGEQPGGVQGVPPDPNQPGRTASVDPPAGDQSTTSTASTSRVAPIGAADSALPNAKGTAPAAPSRTNGRTTSRKSSAPQSKPAAPSTGNPGSVPF